jgi:hypothetical protein
MKTFRAKRGAPFRERPYYDLAEIERMCIDELNAQGLLPREPGAIRIDRFIEKRFGVITEHDDLPDGLLGYSRFGAKGLEAVVVSRALAEDGSTSAERRVTTTLAHEAGHALLHGHLFALGKPQKALFDGQITEPRILCRGDGAGVGTGRPKYAGEWWEFQANQAIGAFLLPRFLVHRALERHIVQGGALGLGRHLPPERRDAAVVEVAETFEVNPAVVKIRLQELYPVEQGRQLTL